MAVPKSIRDAIGLWRGKSKLNQSWLPPGKQVSVSDSSLHIDVDSLGSFATITYDWRFEGKKEEGTLILAMHRKSNSVEIGWVDSWHQQDGVLYLKGEVTPTEMVKTRGQYTAGKETWGWTIDIELTAGELKIKMDNVTPDGKHLWAVDSVYQKA